MNKTFCDRCKQEAKGSSFQVQVYDRHNATYTAKDVCNNCEAGLANWLANDPYDMVVIDAVRIVEEMVSREPKKKWWKR